MSNIVKLIEGYRGSWYYQFAFRNDGVVFNRSKPIWDRKPKYCQWYKNFQVNNNTLEWFLMSDEVMRENCKKFDKPLVTDVQITLNPKHIRLPLSETTKEQRELGKLIRKPKAVQTKSRSL